VLLIVVSVWFYVNESENGMRLIEQAQKLQLEQRKVLFESLLQDAMEDLLFIAKIEVMQRVVEQPDSTWHKQVLAYDLKMLIEQKRNYDQVRYIDVSGKEVVRVNYRNGVGVIVGETDLQHKVNRYYFKESMKKDADEIYVSPIDLNIEHGAIEVPYKPMLRLATPLFDRADKLRGILVVNYLADRLVNSLNYYSSLSVGRLLMVNNQGFWLQGERAGDDWGFMFPDKKHLRMQRRYPDAWELISSNNSGQFINEKGLFTFETVDGNALIAGKALHHSLGDQKQNNNSALWKLVRFIDKQALDKPGAMLKNRYLTINAILALAWGVLAFLLARAKYYKIEAGRQLHEKEKRISEIINSAFDAIITINERGVIETFNPAAVSLFGYQEEDVIGQKVNILMDSPEGEYNDSRSWGFIESGLSEFVGEPGKVKAVTSDGEKIDIEICIGAKQVEGCWLYTAICRQYGRDIKQKYIVG
jgi:PAS domain S-box-containing protein